VIRRDAMRCLEDAIYWLRVRPIARIVQALRRGAAHNFPRSIIHGVEIVDGTDDPSQSSVYFNRFRDSFDLIARYDTRRFERILVDIRSIEVVPDLPGNEQGFFLFGTEACLFTPKFVGQDTTVLAIGIVHEAIHARLDRMRVRQSSVRTDRIERLCREAEVEFSRRCPPHPEIERWLKERSLR